MNVLRKVLAKGGGHMATASKVKVSLEVLLVRSELKGFAEKGLPVSHNIGLVDIVWPRPSVPRRSVAREMVFKTGRCDFTSEPWTKRVVFREEVEDRCGFAVSITEPMNASKARRFLRFAAKYAAGAGADFLAGTMARHSDVLSSPFGALAAIADEKDVPKVIATGVLDLNALPAAGESREVKVPLSRPLSGRAIGHLTLCVRACPLS